MPGRHLPSPTVSRYTVRERDTLRGRGSTTASNACGDERIPFTLRTRMTTPTSDWRWGNIIRPLQGDQVPPTYMRVRRPARESGRSYAVARAFEVAPMAWGCGAYRCTRATLDPSNVTPHNMADEEVVLSFTTHSTLSRARAVRREGFWWWGTSHTRLVHNSTIRITHCFLLAHP